MNVTSNSKSQLTYPVRVEVIILGVFFWLLMWGVAVIEMLPTPHYSFYEDPLVKIVAGVCGFLGGLLFFQGLVVVITSWKKFTLVIDEKGFHGVGGVSFIPWTEIKSIGDVTLRYNLMGQRVHFLTIRVRTLKKIFQREKGYTIWLQRLGKSPDFRITNVKRKDIQAAFNAIQDGFADEIRNHRVQMNDFARTPGRY